MFDFFSSDYCYVWITYNPIEFNFWLEMYVLFIFTV